VCKFTCNQLVNARLTQYLPNGTFSAAGTPQGGRLPPTCERQCLEQPSVPVQNFSQIRSAVSELMRPEQMDRQTDKQQT